MTVERKFCFSCTRHMPVEGGRTVADARGRARFRCGCCQLARLAARSVVAPADQTG